MYVFKRLGKKILQELALCILQDLATNGPGRAKTLELEVVKASSGGKVVKIVDHFEDGSGPLDQSFLDEIDEAIFRFKDPARESPDIKISARQGFAAPYLPPNEEGTFVTPTKRKPRSLDEQMAVSPPAELAAIFNSVTPSLPHLQAVTPAKDGNLVNKNAWESGCEVDPSRDMKLSSKKSRSIL